MSLENAIPNFHKYIRPKIWILGFPGYKILELLPLTLLLRSATRQVKLQGRYDNNRLFQSQKTLDKYKAIYLFFCLVVQDNKLQHFFILSGYNLNFYSNTR